MSEMFCFFEIQITKHLTYLKPHNLDFTVVKLLKSLP